MGESSWGANCDNLFNIDFDSSFLLRGDDCLKKILSFCLLVLLFHSVVAGTTTVNIQSQGVLRGDYYYYLSTIDIGDGDELQIKGKDGAALYSITTLIEGAFFDRTAVIFVKDMKTGQTESAKLEGWDAFYHSDKDFSFFGEKIGFNGGFMSIAGFSPTLGIKYLHIKKEVLTKENKAPAATDVSIAPNKANENDELTCNYTYIDEEGDAEGDTLVRWYKENTVIYSGKILQKGYLKENDKVLCAVLPQAKTGTVRGEEVKSTQITILAALKLPPGAKTGDVKVDFTEWVQPLKNKGLANPIEAINSALTVTQANAPNVSISHNVLSGSENFIVLKNAIVGNSYKLSIAPITAGGSKTKPLSGTSDIVEEKHLIEGTVK